MDMNLVDEVIKVSDREALYEARLLAKNEGILAGSSSGAALAAVRKLTERVKNCSIVTVLPDRGDRYFSKNLYT
jgi:cysteine synthase A